MRRNQRYKIGCVCACVSVLARKRDMWWHLNQPADAQTLSVIDGTTEVRPHIKRNFGRNTVSKIQSKFAFSSFVSEHKFTI